MTNIAVYQGLSNEELAQLGKDLEQAYVQAENAYVPPEASRAENAEAENLELPDEVEVRSEEVNELADLLGIKPSVYRQINAALTAGKQHLMFYGPPGTGKTTLAQHCARSLASAHTLITGSSDWSSQDVIGGYQPIGEGQIAFIPGILLRAYDRPLIIDELNRCDIDKVIGPLFTVLSGQKTTLPYRTEAASPDSDFYEILPKPKPGAKATAFAPGPAWRLIATINSIDKASLYQMSYALTRRFAWIYVDVPEDLQQFLVEYFAIKGWSSSGATSPIGDIWHTINKERPIGPAPILDWLHALRAMDSTFDFFVTPDSAQAELYLDGFDMFLLPMLDGLFKEAATRIGHAICAALGLAEGSPHALRVLRRLDSIAV